MRCADEARRLRISVVLPNDEGPGNRIAGAFLLSVQQWPNAYGSSSVSQYR